MLIKSPKFILSVSLAFVLGAGVGFANPIDMPLGGAVANNGSLSKAVDNGILRRGARGSAVRELQAALKKLGYSVAVDGVFGRGTESAVKAFQRSRRLSADGLVGKGTLKALKSAKPASSSTTSNNNSSSSSRSSGTRTVHNNDGAEDRIAEIFGLRSSDNSPKIQTPLKRGSKGESVKELQRLLKKHGYSVSVDGDFGSGTRNAVRAFQRSKGLSADGVVGKQTLAALTQKPSTTKPQTSSGGKANWMSIARSQLGVREISGSRHNPTIQAYHAQAGMGSRQPDETAWCSSFANWVMKRAGHGGTNRANARSWLNYGQRLSRPVPGCIVVFWRGSRNGWQGHVAFYVGDNGSSIRVLGGNQSNSVNIANYSKSRILGYRWPNGVPLP